MNPILQHKLLQTRRHFLKNSALGLGAASFGMLNNEASAAPAGNTGGLPGLPHFAPKAKKVIWLFMAGAPSQIDMLDYKPAMDKMFNKDLPDSIRNGQRLTGMTTKQARFPIAPSKYKL